MSVTERCQRASSPSGESRLSPKKLSTLGGSPRRPERNLAAASEATAASASSLSFWAHMTAFFLSRNRLLEFSHFLLFRSFQNVTQTSAHPPGPHMMFFWGEVCGFSCIPDSRLSRTTTYVRTYVLLASYQCISNIHPQRSSSAYSHGMRRSIKNTTALNLNSSNRVQEYRDVHEQYSRHLTQG